MLDAFRVSASIYTSSTIYTVLRSAHCLFIPISVAVRVTLSKPYLYCQQLQVAAT